MASCGADLQANASLTILLDGKSFTLPTINLDDPIYNIPPSTGPVFDPIPQLTIEDLTTGTVEGNGTFDTIMKAITAHLKLEYEQNRITGNEYTKAYIALVTAALSTGTQFLLGKQNAYWQAVLVQAQAQIAQVELVKARVDMATAKTNLIAMQYQALTAEAGYGLTKIKIATEDASFCLVTAQKSQIDYTIANLLPKQVLLLQEQIEVQRAQTMDTRSTGGAAIAGVIGKQKELYTQQITSYKRDSENKFLKFYTDAWITQKTIDEGLLPPNNFTNASVDALLNTAKANLAM